MTTRPNDKVDNRDCGDKLCEMSYTSNYPIVEQAFENLKQCITKAVK